MGLASELAFRRSSDYSFDDLIRDLQDYTRNVDKKIATMDAATAAIGAASVAWNPTMSFVVPGDTNFTMDGTTSVRVIRVGKFVSMAGLISTSIATHTTGSGFLTIGNGVLPYPISQRGVGVATINGITLPASSKLILMEAISGVSYLRLCSSIDRTVIDNTHHVSGTAIQINFSILYETT
jgi:hypothetical protein